jgi:hypothetical protein
MLCSVRISKIENPFDLALVHWYDFKHPKVANKLYKYDCPWIELTNTYNFVPVESLIELVHIVPRFDKENEYLMNTFMF